MWRELQKNCRSDEKLFERQFFIKWIEEIEVEGEIIEGGIKGFFLNEEE